ncbi:MAG: hypothetical protein ACOH2J_22045 [Allorhizobium sp.]
MTDTPIFDLRDEPTSIIDKATEWTPTRQATKRGFTIHLDSDGPCIAWRTSAQAARITSNKYSGQAANDNVDWPLAKLLRTEGNGECLALAERYRDLHDAATQPTQLIGKEADDTFHLVQRLDKDGKPKGLKVVTGKKASVDSQPARNRAAPVPKKWNGDWPILDSIDAKRELAVIRAKLAYVPKIIDAFEMSVVDGLTLEETGLRLGAGSKGAKGEARARVFDGFGIVDRHWRLQDRKAA